MKILMINKFLHHNGGSETYILSLGAALQKEGHEVQYFGMEHEGRVVGNAVEAYTSDMDFHSHDLLAMLSYSFKTVYSFEARKKLRAVLDSFEPDVCHLNNFNYQLTPSVIVEIVKWKKDTGRKCRIVYTSHDYQLVCPNHLCNNPNTHENCEKCLGGHFSNCIKQKCIHGSTVKSALGAFEAYYWNRRGIYKNIDTFVCCSAFMKSMLDSNEDFKDKTICMHNFLDNNRTDGFQKKNYVLYFGRYSEEKGIMTLLEACRALPEVKFIFAGKGPLEAEVEKVPNVKNIGFQTSDTLVKLISEARFTVYPSEWYENCPYSVMESQLYGTPVIASDIGGIPELIRDGYTGELFESGNVVELSEKIKKLWDDRSLNDKYIKLCLETVRFDTTAEYVSKILDVYKGNVPSC